MGAEAVALAEMSFASSPHLTNLKGKIVTNKSSEEVVVLPMEEIIITLAACGAVLVVASFFTGFKTFGLALVLLGIAVTMYGYGLKSIPADPITAGLITVKGIRSKKVVKGLIVTAPYWPFFQDVILVKATTINQDLPINVFCRATNEVSAEDGSFQVGPEVNLPVSITFRPNEQDGKELIKYLNNGGEAGVKTILDDILPQLMKEIGTSYTFETLIGARQNLIDAAATLLTGVNVAELTPDQKKHFYNEMKVKGNGDSLNLGIVITKINVGAPIPSEAIRVAAEDRTREEFERRGEVYEVETELAQAQALWNKYNQVGERKDFQACLMEIRRRKSIKQGHGQVLEIPGIESLGVAIASIIAGIKTPSNTSGAPSADQQPRPMRRRSQE